MPGLGDPRERRATNGTRGEGARARANGCGFLQKCPAPECPGQCQESELCFAQRAGPKNRLCRREVFTQSHDLEANGSDTCGRAAFGPMQRLPVGRLAVREAHGLGIRWLYLSRVHWL